VSSKRLAGAVSLLVPTGVIHTFCEQLSTAQQTGAEQMKEGDWKNQKLNRHFDYVGTDLLVKDSARTVFRVALRLHLLVLLSVPFFAVNM
jgi:hypothetical protein